MTTYAPDETGRRLEELADRERQAWQDYREGLRELEGRDYDEAESASWDDLQKALQDVAAERAELAEVPASG
jgi:hypothetical protein